MKIRPAVQEDVREMMEIFNYEVRNSTASFAITEQSYEERLAWFRSHGGERHPLIAAEQDGRVAGYACLSDYRPYEAYKGTAELSVYVSRDFRRQGIGEALMRELLVWPAAAGSFTLSYPLSREITKPASVCMKKWAFPTAEPCTGQARSSGSC